MGSVLAVVCRLPVCGVSDAATSHTCRYSAFAPPVVCAAAVETPRVSMQQLKGGDDGGANIELDGVLLN